MMSATLARRVLTRHPASSLRFFSAAPPTSACAENEKLPDILTSLPPLSLLVVPLSAADEQEENFRVNALTPAEKAAELESLDAMIRSLQHRLGINNGDAYSWRGRFKNLSANYGLPFMVYWTSVWCATGVGCYAAMEYGGVEALPLIQHLDQLTGFDLANKIDPSLGNIAVAVAVNEMLEPIRLPFIVATTQPVVDSLMGKKR